MSEPAATPPEGLSRPAIADTRTGRRPATPPDGRIVSVQYLRALAALMVVLHHATTQFSEFPGTFHTQAGQAGVDLFFAISGFVMVFVTSTREQSAGDFLLSRATRIIPIYWFYTFACFGLLLVLPRLFNTNEASARHLLLSLLFVPHTIPEDPGDYSPLVKLGWTLNYEVFFYIVFALAMLVSFRRRVALAVLALAACIVVPNLLRDHGWKLPDAAAFYTHRIVGEFALGMIIARLYLARRLDWLGAIPGALLVIAGLAAMVVNAPDMEHNRLAAFGLPAALILIGTLAIERRGRVRPHPLLLLIGDASYSIYLVHIFPISVLRLLWHRGSLPVQGWVFPPLFVGLCFGAAILFGVTSYWLLEKPLLKWFRRYLHPRRVPRGAVEHA